MAVAASARHDRRHGARDRHVDVEDRDSVVLGPLQAYVVPAGVLHRTRAPAGRSAVLMVERAGVVPAGDQD